jgi:8-oxo-dGTP diphosphatase
MADNQTIVQRIAFKAVITNDKNEVLLLREASTYEEGTNIGKYHLPGGRLEPGEAWQDGLKREVAEESGLEVEIIKPLFVGEWRPVIKGVQNQIVALFMVCKATQTSSVKLSEEHDDYKWVGADAWHNLNVMSPEDEVLTTFFAEANTKA